MLSQLLTRGSSELFCETWLMRWFSLHALSLARTIQANVVVSDRRWCMDWHKTNACRGSNGSATNDKDSDGVSSTTSSNNPNPHFGNSFGVRFIFVVEPLWRIRSRAGRFSGIVYQVWALMVTRFSWFSSSHNSVSLFMFSHCHIPCWFVRACLYILTSVLFDISSYLLVVFIRRAYHYSKIIHVHAVLLCFREVWNVRRAFDLIR